MGRVEEPSVVLGCPSRCWDPRDVHCGRWHDSSVWGWHASRAEHDQKTVYFELELFLAPVICAEMIKLFIAKWVAVFSFWAISLHKLVPSPFPATTPQGPYLLWLLSWTPPKGLSWLDRLESQSKLTFFSFFPRGCIQIGKEMNFFFGSLQSPVQSLCRKPIVDMHPLILHFCKIPSVQRLLQNKSLDS